MTDRVRKYKIRRYLRLLSRMDDDSDEGRWITTENGHKVHINGEGEPDKGNPRVMEKMKDGEKKKKTMRDFVDLVGKFPYTLEGSQQFWKAVDGYLKDAPEETKITFKGEDEEWVKIEDGNWLSTTNGNIIDADEMLEMFQEEEFGEYPDDDRGITYEEPDVPDSSEETETAERSSDPRRVGRSDVEKRISSLLDGSDESREKLIKELREVPVGSVFLVRDGTWRDADIEVVRKIGENAYKKEGYVASCEEDNMAEYLEYSSGELDVITGDNFEKKTIPGKNTHDLWRNRGRSSAVAMLREAPTGTTITFKPSDFQGDDETILTREKGGLWYNADLDLHYYEYEVFDYMRDVGFTREGEAAASDLVEYQEPDQTKYVSKETGGHTLDGCRRFLDKADGTHSYEGDGQDAIDFFYENSNFDELLSDLDEEQESAFRAYTEGEMMRSFAHSGWDEMPSGIQDCVKCMDEIIDQATLDEGIVVSRLSNAALLLGYDHKQALFTELKAMVGKKVVSRGFMSCGAADEGLTIGSASKMVEYKIAVPGGTTGAGMWLGDERVNDWGPRQREFCINRDSEFRVGSVVFDPERGVYEVEMEYLRTLPHDYGG